MPYTKAMLAPYPSSLESNLLAFARTLREQAFLLGPGEVSLALSALEGINLQDRDDVFLSLQTLWAKNPNEQSRFAKLFDEYWLGGLLATEELNAQLNQAPPQPKLQNSSMLDWDEGVDSDETMETMGYSTHEVIAADDAIIQTKDIEACHKLVKRLAKQLATKPSRRFVASAQKTEIADLRRTMRQSIGNGGELFKLKFKNRKLAKTRIMFVFDVSGSMMVYSHFLLQLAYAFVTQRHIGKAEVFGFSTDLYRLTPALQSGGVQEAIKAAKNAMPGRSGGTKIGTCLASLLEHYANYLDPKTVLIINSDGWDTGDLDLLKRSMQRLKERSHQIIWLNPLAASPGYEPTASGMQTAMPYIDIFAPSHNLASLEALERRLMKANR